MTFRISSSSLVSASETIEQVVTDVCDDLAEPGRCYNLGPTVGSAVDRIPGILSGIKVRIEEHVGGYATLLGEAAEDADRVDRQVAGGG